MKYQPNIPSELFNKFIENLGYMPEGQSILVVRDFYTACYLAINNKVTFVSDDQEAIELFTKTVIYNPEFGSDDKYIFVRENTKTEWLNVINWIVKNMKFDAAIMNPPYDKNLHLKILEKVIPIADNVVNISPVRWLQDPLAKYKKNSDYNKFEETISKKINTLDIIPMNEAESIFNAAFNMNLGIYNIKNGGFDYTCFNNKIIDKIINQLPDTIAKHAKFSIPEKWSLVMSLMVGGNKGRTNNCSYWNNNYDNMVYYNNKNKFGQTYEEYRKSKCWGNVKVRSEAYHIEFNTELELQNFYNSLHTKIFRYLFSQTLIDIHPHPEFYMWMSDYTQPWTDKRFCEYFGITGYIDDEHADPGSEWEIILKTMEEYK